MNDSNNRHQDKRRLTLGAKLLLGIIVLLSSSIAFCCTCVSVGYAAFVVTYPPPPQGSIQGIIGMALWVSAYVGGVLVAVIAGRFVVRKVKDFWSESPKRWED